MSKVGLKSKIWKTALVLAAAATVTAGVKLVSSDFFNIKMGIATVSKQKRTQLVNFFGRIETPKKFNQKAGEEHPYKENNETQCFGFAEYAKITPYIAGT